MADDNEITIRTVKVTDIENLKTFFIKAYGAVTIFQNELFLMHYFDSRIKSMPALSKCLIGINSKEEIVSHYGGLDYNLKINDEIHSMIWGVSAYTLPEWRGKGGNSKIVDFIIQNNEINGVIGFTPETASFYQKQGYNIFDFDRFTKYVLILDHGKVLEVINYIKQNSDRFKNIIPIQSTKKNNFDFGKVVELTKENIWNFKLNLDEDSIEIITTHRTKEFLIWRFLESPFIKYNVYGYVEDAVIQTYIAFREENLEPLNYKVNRIIDLYGKKKGISVLLNKSIQESVSKNHIYIDFSMFGTIYDKELISNKFVRLEDEDCCILPQVTAPIENRPNNEFLGIKSKTHNKVIQNLSKQNVYFTRMDSDRDRLNKLSQVNIAIN